MYRISQLRHGQDTYYVIRMYRNKQDKTGKVLFQIDLAAGTVRVGWTLPVVMHNVPDVAELSAITLGCYSASFAEPITDYLLEMGIGLS